MSAHQTVTLAEMIKHQKWRVFRTDEKARRATKYRSHYEMDIPVERAILANLVAQQDDGK